MFLINFEECQLSMSEYSSKKGWAFILLGTLYMCEDLTYIMQWYLQFFPSVSLLKKHISTIFIKTTKFHLVSQGWHWSVPLDTLPSFSLGLGPVPWLMMGEVFPGKIRSSASSLAAGFNWTCSFITTETVPGQQLAAPLVPRCEGLVEWLRCGPWLFNVDLYRSIHFYFL